MIFLRIKRDSVFAGLIFTSHVLAHCAIFSRSEFSVAAAVSGYSMTSIRLVSSARSFIFNPMSFTMSLIYRRNNSGPRFNILESNDSKYIKYAYQMMLNELEKKKIV